MCPLLFTGDGKPCFIEQNTCDRNVDSLCDVCNGTCLNNYINYNYTVVIIIIII